ncbi:hypothetical protein MCEREM21A_01693 [Sphingomonadaceae bacterium]
MVSSRKSVRYHGLDTEVPFRPPIGGQGARRSLRLVTYGAAKTNQSSGPELGLSPFEPDSAHIGLAWAEKSLLNSLQIPCSLHPHNGQAIQKCPE